MQHGGSEDLHPISTHAPAGGATSLLALPLPPRLVFLLTPLREGRPARRVKIYIPDLHFYSRPCGRGDTSDWLMEIFPIRNFYSRPCGRGDLAERLGIGPEETFLLTPLREGRQRAA